VETAAHQSPEYVWRWSSCALECLQYSWSRVVSNHCVYEFKPRKREETSTSCPYVAFRYSQNFRVAHKNRKFSKAHGRGALLDEKIALSDPRSVHLSLFSTSPTSLIKYSSFPCRDSTERVVGSQSRHVASCSFVKGSKPLVVDSSLRSVSITACVCLFLLEGVRLGSPPWSFASGRRPRMQTNTNSFTRSPQVLSLQLLQNCSISASAEWSRPITARGPC